VRHSLSSVLAAAIAAVLAGAQSFTAIGEWIADAPPPVPACLGIRRDPLTRQFEPPGEATIRRILEAVDAAVLDTEVGAWLSARLQAARPPARSRPGRPALAVDGKALSGTRHASADGQAMRARGQERGQIRRRRRRSADQRGPGRGPDAARGRQEPG
jgi:hypothetical protein